MSTFDPPVTPLSPNNHNPNSPKAGSRSQDRQEISSLNQRLEHYISLQTTKTPSLDVSITEIKSQVNADLAQLQQSFFDDYNKLRAERNDLDARHHQLELLRSKKREHLRELERKLDNLRKHNQALWGVHRDLEKELGDIQAHEVAIHRDISVITRNLDVEKNTVKALRRKIDAIKGNLDDAHNLLARNKSLNEDLANLRRQTDDDLRRYKNLVRELQQQQNDLESEIRHSLADERNLTKILDEAQAKHDAEIAAMTEELRQTYEDKIAAYQDEYNKCVRERDHLFRLKNQLEADIQALRADTNAANTGDEDLNNQIAQLEKALQAARARASDVLAQKAREIHKLKELFKLMDSEYDNLLDLKLALDAQIKKYRLLLDVAEGKRHDFRLSHTGSGKRKVHTTSRLTSDAIISPLSPSKRKSPTAHPVAHRSPKARSPSHRSPSHRSPSHVASASAHTSLANKFESVLDEPRSNNPLISLAGADPAKQTITIVNDSDSVVPLANWVIRTKSFPRGKFRFPNDSDVAPGQTVVVGVGQDQSSDVDFVWAAPDVHIADNDEIRLINPHSVVVSTLEIDAHGSNVSMSIDTNSDGFGPDNGVSESEAPTPELADPNPNGCSVM